ncbi:recombinase family protein [Neobacillus cucumis]|uniref:recombinase family protein n=1 Tax=Neobacillus cucumis TaxID=1740721 RepID=UPI00399C6F92
MRQVIRELESGDTFVVIRMDRLGRSSRQLIELVEDFETRNITLVILDMNIDTRMPTVKFFLTIMAGFAEMEKTILKRKSLNNFRILFTCQICFRVITLILTQVYCNFNFIKGDYMT